MASHGACGALFATMCHHRVFAKSLHSGPVQNGLAIITEV